MAAEFYRKSTVLYEEFKKRELHYFNIERSMNDNLTREINMPLEDYLAKINKREKETENSYRNLLRNLEEMDKHTDQMSLKLEKLNALRGATLNSHVTTWPSLSSEVNRLHHRPYYEDSFVPDAPLTSLHHSMLNERKILANPTSENVQNAITQSTQTENIYCEKCSHCLTGEVRRLASITHDESLIEDLTNFNRVVYKDIEPLSNSNEVTFDKSISSESILNPVGESTPYKNISSLDSPIKNKANFSPSLMQNGNINKENHPISDRVVSMNADVPNEPKILINNENKITDKRNTNIMESQVDLSNPIESKDTDYPKNKMFEKAASKSDDESINHEFDFLESDQTPNTIENLPEQSSETENISEDKSNNNLDYTSPLVSVINTKPQHEEVSTENDVKTNVKNAGNLLIPKDDKIESSLSEGSPSPAHHSADVSNHSESESSSETETPFTASAAYQALLGNAAVPKTAKRVPSPSDSDSEDEIENVLSSAVRRTSNINFDALTQVQKKEEKKTSIPEVIPKTNKKSSISLSTGTSQSKLLKNTRKVLGLETSSGSEMEPETKSTAHKIEEDSDEFDFYN